MDSWGGAVVISAYTQESYIRDGSARFDVNVRLPLNSRGGYDIHIGVVNNPDAAEEIIDMLPDAWVVSIDDGRSVNVVHEFDYSRIKPYESDIWVYSDDVEYNFEVRVSLDSLIDDIDEAVVELLAEHKEEMERVQSEARSIISEHPEMPE